MYTCGLVDAKFYTFVLLGLALEVLLVGRLLRQRMWRSYCFFFLYILWVCSRTVVLLALELLAPTRFAGVFWVTDAVGLPLKFLIVWEVFRHTFPKGSSLSRLASKGFVVAGTALVVFLIDAFWGFKAYAIFNSLFLALDRSFGFAGAVMTLGLVLIARYYGVPLGQNVWGMAVGFGGWASVLTANNAIFDLDHSFIPFWRIVSPLSFISMIAIWIWAMWKYDPNPAIEPVSISASEMDEWNQEWGRTVSSVRRIIHP